MMAGNNIEISIKSNVPLLNKTSEERQEFLFNHFKSCEYDLQDLDVRMNFETLSIYGQTIIAMIPNKNLDSFRDRLYKKGFNYYILREIQTI